jgi:nicotinamide-nucleotide amidase
MFLEIITIGDELLNGLVTDTNSPWIAQELEVYGFKTIRFTTVGDDSEKILDAIADAHSRANLVIITGGLGSTNDDITLNVLCKFFNSDLHFSEEIYTSLSEMYRANNWNMNRLTKSQALVPEKATVIKNPVGTAPATWFEDERCTTISLPGVPYEMKHLMTSEIIPRIRARFNPSLRIARHTIWTSGITESALAIELEEYEKQLPPSVHLAYLPQSGIVRLRITVETNTSDTDAQAQLKHAATEICKLIRENIIAEGDGTIEEHLGQLLVKNNATVGTAESCTGGKIASMITSVPGSSRYFRGSIVAYSNEIKAQLLDVSTGDLEKFGAVSQPVVEQMAKGARKMLGVDYAIATSGLAGPAIEPSSKPVGTTFIAIATPTSIISTSYTYNITRAVNIQRTSNIAIAMLLKELNSIE